MAEIKSKVEEHRQRLVELITLFSRCRQSNNIKDGCGGGKSVCTPCPYEKEHGEMWNLLREDDLIHKEGMAAIKPLLPEDVRGELYPVPLKGYGKQRSEAGG